MRTALRVAVCAFLFHPHGGGEDKIGAHRRYCRIGVRHDDEIVRVAVSLVGLIAIVGRRLDIVVHLHPIEVQLAVIEHPVLEDGVIARLVRKKAVRQLPYLLGMSAVFFVGDDHVGRQAMCKGTDLAGGSAGRRLAGEREGAVAGLRYLSRKQVEIIDHVIGPDPAYMLVEAHRPERHDLRLRIGVEFGELFEKRTIDAR